jgi:hypothetical protein
VAESANIAIKTPSLFIYLLFLSLTDPLAHCVHELRQSKNLPRKGQNKLVSIRKEAAQKPYFILGTTSKTAVGGQSARQPIN